MQCLLKSIEKHISVQNKKKHPSVYTSFSLYLSIFLFILSPTSPSSPTLSSSFFPFPILLPLSSAKAYVTYPILNKIPEDGLRSTETSDIIAIKVQSHIYVHMQVRTYVRDTTEAEAGCQSGPAGLRGKILKFQNTYRIT